MSITLKSKPDVFLRKGLDYRDLEQGTEIEIDPNDESSSESDFETDVENSFKEEFNKLKLLDSSEEIDLNSLTLPELKTKMTPITDDGLVLKLVTVCGTGPVIPDQSIVLMHYNAYIIENDKPKDYPFDSTYGRNRPFKFLAGSKTLIHGLELGVSTMRKGEHAKFWVQCSYAYGPMGCPPRIPEHADIVCDVEVIKFTHCKDALEFEDMLPEEQKNAPFSKVYPYCKQEHAMANELYKTKKYAAAASRYARAIRHMECVSAANEEEDNARDKLLLHLYRNLSLCNINLKKAHRALTNAYKALRLDDKSAKTFYCLGQAHALKANYNEARNYLLQARELMPHDPDVTKALINLNKKTEQHLTWEKSFYQKMFPNENKEITAISQETEEFVKTIADTIDRFQNSNDEDYCFPSTFTSRQIDVIKEIAKSKKLHFFEKIHNGSKILRIKKNIH